jgi:acetolactate synthase-1/2/3 large subunit
MTLHAGELLVACLESHNVDRVFCLPGESYLAVLDALFDHKSIQTVTARHEGGAGFMALADGRMSGRPGVCFVSRGPGAANAAVAIHSAQEDATPLVLFIGDVPRADSGRRCFQEINYSQMYGGLAKGVWNISETALMPEIVARAFQVAQSGTPGPVVITLPEDMLVERVEASALPPSHLVPMVPTGPSTEQLDLAIDLLSRSKRPLLMAGGMLSLGRGREILQEFSESHCIPVVTTYKRQDVFSTTHKNYAGYMGFGTSKKQITNYHESDLVLAIGTRLTDVTTQGRTFPVAPVPTQPLLHVYPDGEPISWSYQTTGGIVCDPALFLSALSKRLESQDQLTPRKAWVAKLHDIAEERAKWTSRTPPDGVAFGDVVVELGKTLKKDAVISTDGGNFGGWVHRYFPFESTNTLLGVGSGSMGPGVPGGIAAALRYPDREIVVFVGDGGFLMTGCELATAMQLNLRLRVFVANNKSLGTIRLYQEREYPGRTSATNLHNPDFAALGDAFGAKGLRIDSPNQVASVVKEALDHPGTVVVEVNTSLEEISANISLSQIRNVT